MAWAVPAFLGSVPVDDAAEVGANGGHFVRLSVAVAVAGDLVRAATWWWMLAVFPVLLGVLPVKDMRWNDRAWYRFLVWAKFVLLWLAVTLSAVGAIQFLRSVG